MSENATVTPVRRATELRKKPSRLPSLRSLAWEKPTPPTAFQTGPSCRQRSVGIMVRFKR